MKNARIGDYLVEYGLLKPEQLEHVLQIQREARENGQDKQFGDIVVEQGYVSEINFAKALAAKLHVPYVDLSTYEFDPETVRKIPEHVAKKYLNVYGMVERGGGAGEWEQPDPKED